jgi:NADP-dependent 3-hydroxy acid dehydrogenase YdfG
MVAVAGRGSAMPGVEICSTAPRGLRAAVETLRLELAREGIGVGLIAASQVNDTVHFERDVMKGFVDGGWHPGPPEAVADAIAFMLGQPEGVAINERRLDSELNE